MMWLVALALLHAPTSPDVTVQLLSGDTQAGVLVELNGTRVAVEVSGKKHAYEVRDLQAVLVRDTAEGDGPTAESRIDVQLVDGSRIIGTGYTVKDRMAEIQWGERVASIETRHIRAARFRPPAEALDAQWQDIVDGQSHGDVIVLRRSDTALDQLEGVFGHVTEETVEFEYDGELIPVKRTKLEGMVYHHALGRELADPVCVVQELGGTLWHAETIELRGGGLEIVTPAGVRCRVPWEQVARIDYSSSNVRYLSDLEFELVECTPYIGSRLSATQLTPLYAPYRDSSFEGEGLWLADGENVQRYQKGLAIHSRSEVVFRLTEPHRKLQAVAGIDSRLQGRGHLLLIIEGDGDELFRREISGEDAPLRLDLDIEGARRLTIRVDYGESLDVADHLNLCNARIIK